jgi:hypothetical protein
MAAVIALIFIWVSVEQTKEHIGSGQGRCRQAG